MSSRIAEEVAINIAFARTLVELQPKIALAALPLSCQRSNY
jgi:hypothetical protein